MSESLHLREQGVIVRNTQPEDIPKIVIYKKNHFHILLVMAIYGIQKSLESHLRIFPQGQFVAVEPDGLIVGSASTLMVLLNPEYAEHTWKEITATECSRIIILMGIVCAWCRYFYTSKT